MAQTQTPLATSMLSSKKKDVALELFMLELNARGIRCQITPAFLDALFTGNIATKSASEIPQASSFGCAVSLAGTRLEDIDVSLVLRKADDSEDLSPQREERALRRHRLDLYLREPTLQGPQHHRRHLRILLRLLTNGRDRKSVHS